MVAIDVKHVTERDHGWHVVSSLDSSEYHVTVDTDYYQQLAGGQASVEELVQASFEFLLEREPVSSIMREFDLSLIQRYFDDYELTMQERFSR